MPTLKISSVKNENLKKDEALSLSQWCRKDKAFSRDSTIDFYLYIMVIGRTDSYECKEAKMMKRKFNEIRTEKAH